MCCDVALLSYCADAPAAAPSIASTHVHLLCCCIQLLPAGAPFLPYLITDKVVAPPQLHHCYSEKLALMPNCYFVNDYKRCHRCVG
jgi:hypothetical protein